MGINAIELKGEQFEDINKLSVQTWEALVEQENTSPCLLFAPCPPPDLDLMFGPSQRQDRERSPSVEDSVW